MGVKYLCPFWGLEHLTASEFVQYVMNHEYDGIEINLPISEDFISSLLDEITLVKAQKPDFKVIVQIVEELNRNNIEEYFEAIHHKLKIAKHFQPYLINIHTGRDYFTFEENCSIIEQLEQFAANYDLTLVHEIHRGRFSFHLATLKKYLERYPSLKLTADFSHFFVVSESLLHDQHEDLDSIIPFIHHLHARVGSEQASQVSNPFAPEYNEHLSRFLELWKKVVQYAESQSFEMTITPEFGPYPYLPREPFSKKPLADSPSLNFEMKNHLKQCLV